MTEKTYNTGDVIYAEGDMADAAYLLMSGTVELLRKHGGQETVVEVKEAGQAFGEAALFQPRELRPYTARARAAATLRVIAPEAFAAELSNCPEAVQKILAAVASRMPSMPQEKPAIPGLPKGEVATITLTPGTDALKAQFKPLEIPVSNLPFRIGGYPEGGERNRKDPVHLALASQKNPLIISRQHCEIACDEQGNLVVGDLGSRFCTIVNGVSIGRGRGVYAMPLQKGENEVILGNPDRHYLLKISCN